jgi:decaprenylphospho-beta-D-ribofuranose 2-oxidase
VEVGSADEVVAVLADRPPGGVIARGLGRSYGDPAQNAGGTVLDTTAMRGIVHLDAEAGLVTARAGASLDDLMRSLLPNGLFVPVTPGTRFVTVGGAVASDIHGKNHHRDGTFGAAVAAIELVRPTGERVVLTPEAQPDEHWATVGGMGLTGVMASVTFRLQRVATSRMVVDTDRAADLDECMALLAEADDATPYSVAWIDCLARGASLGRSVVTRGRHAELDELPGRARRDPFSFAERSLPAVPWAPPGLLNRATVGAFNELWFRKAPRHRHDEVQSLGTFFHPLDGVQAWNRLYGPGGMVQHQCVVPFGAEDVLREVVERLAAARAVSFLAVLKRFGAANPAPLSFPMPGWTLALDIPAGLSGLGPLLDGIDDLVLDAGGRLYLAKDARARPEVLRAMYPRLGEWQEVQRRMDPLGLMRSDLSRRLGLIG